MSGVLLEENKGVFKINSLLISVLIEGEFNTVIKVTFNHRLPSNFFS